MDIISLSQAKQYTDMVALGLANVTVDEATTSVIFTLKETGEQRTLKFPTPKDGDTAFYYGEAEPTDPNVRFWFKPGGDYTGFLSPTAYVEETTTGARIVIIDKNGKTEAEIQSGKKEIDDTQVSLVTTYSSKKIYESLTNYYTKTEVDSAISTEGAKYNPKSNFKTINGQSIVGSGNITIQGGSGEGGTTVVANPILSGNEELATSIQIGDEKYVFPQTNTNGLTSSQITMLESVLYSVAFTDASGKSKVDALIASLRSGVTPDDPDEPTVKTLSSISATKTKTSYTVGETFSTSDVVVTAHYSDDTTEVVTSSATIGTVDTSASGSKTLSISYSENGIEKTTTVAITVVENSGGDTPTVVPLTWTHTKISSNGSASDDENNRATDFAEVDATKTYTIRATQTDGAYNPNVTIYYYNNSKGFISRVTSVVRGTTTPQSVLEIPEGCAYFRLNIATANDSYTEMIEVSHT